MWSSRSHVDSLKICQEDKSFKRKSDFAAVDWHNENSVITDSNAHVDSKIEPD